MRSILLSFHCWCYCSYFHLDGIGRRHTSCLDDIDHHHTSYLGGTGRRRILDWGGTGRRRKT